jgi:hypothetical protein
MKLGCNGAFDGVIRSLSENVGLRFWSAHEIALRVLKTLLVIGNDSDIEKSWIEV